MPVGVHAALGAEITAKAGKTDHRAMTTAAAVLWAISVAAAAAGAWWVGARWTRKRLAAAIHGLADRIHRGVAPGSEALWDVALPELEALREALAVGYVPRGSERLETAWAAVARVSDYLERSAGRRLGSVLGAAPPAVKAAIEDVLDSFEGIRTHKPTEPLALGRENLTQVLREVIDEFAAESRGTVKFVAPDRPVAAMLAKEVFQDAVYLVLLNAEQFSAAKPVEVRLTEDGRRARIVVRDRGPGFSGEALERAFEPFYTTESGALGLGLTHARWVMQAHGGEILLRNREDGGGEAEIVLPMAPWRC